MSKCPSGKIKYIDELEARIAIAGIGAHRASQDDVRSYQCSRCKAWHITTKNNAATVNTPGVRQRRFERRKLKRSEVV